MSTPTNEQIQEFNEWKENNAGRPVSPKVIRGVIDDDMTEAEQAEKKRAGWDRNYNHPPESVGKRLVDEQE